MMLGTCIHIFRILNRRLNGPERRFEVEAILQVGPECALCEQMLTDTVLTEAKPISLSEEQLAEM